MKNLNIGVLIYTYDRILDARANMDIIREYWPVSKSLHNLKIAHIYNGQEKWYPKKYKEDFLIRQKNPGHFQGAADMIDAGMKKFLAIPSIDYVIVLASDTWLLKPKYLEGLLDKMQKQEKYLATCAWNIKEMPQIFDSGMAVDFFILDLKWAKKYKMFPIDYKKFRDKYNDFLMYYRISSVSLEKLVFARYGQALYRQFENENEKKKNCLDRMLHLKEREFIHTHKDEYGSWHRQMYWPAMGLATHHDLKPKKEILKKLKMDKGQGIKEILDSKL